MRSVNLLFVTVNSLSIQSSPAHHDISLDAGGKLRGTELVGPLWFINYNNMNLI